MGTDLKSVPVDNDLMIIDSHIHIFSPKIIANVSRRLDMVKRLHLQVEGAEEKTTIAALRQDMVAAGVSSCLLLPTAAAVEVRNTNRSCWSQANKHDFLLTAGTLHPDYADNDGELSWFAEVGIRAIKLCSFSQGFLLQHTKPGPQGPVRSGRLYRLNAFEIAVA